MKTALLDVNVLTAMLWPAHEHHEAAHRWIGARAQAGWASCPLTQLGFVRLVSNPAFSRDSLSPSHAAALLTDNLRHERHEFWKDTLPVAAAVKDLDDRLQGHNQWTDAYLLATAIAHKGLLATFDRGVVSLAGATHAGSVELVLTRTQQ